MKPPRDPALDLPLIRERIAKCKGFQIMRMQRTLEHSRYLHFKNYSDVAPLLQPIGKPEVIKQLMPMGSENLKHLMLETIRRLVNYLNSSSYLVDHTRFLIGRIYNRKDPLYREISQKLEAVYFGSAIPELVRGLRHTGTHVMLPMVTMEFSFDHMHLETKLDLSAWQEASRGWTKLPKAREHLAALKENPSLYPIIREYHQIDSQFFQWLDERQKTEHVIDFQQLEGLQNELRNKYTAAGINPDELTSV